jgi:hypothetical protein
MRWKAMMMFSQCRTRKEKTYTMTENGQPNSMPVLRDNRTDRSDPSLTADLSDLMRRPSNNWSALAMSVSSSAGGERACQVDCNWIDSD